MSLVAYDASSDEETNSVEDDEPVFDVLRSKNNEIKILDTPEETNGHISDEDEIYSFNEKIIDLDKDEKKKINLPLPKKSNEIDKIDNDTNNLSLHLKLPTPKASSIRSNIEIVEEDDEFLHKKALPPTIEKPPAKKPTVKITIPSLSQFMDFKVENKKETNTSLSKNCSTLLSILPEPKNEEIFKTRSSDITKKRASTVTSLIPDHVKNRMQQAAKKISTHKTAESLVHMSDSEESDEDENQDFFSLNTKMKLPQVSDNEIKAMVEKKVAQMTRASKKIDEMVKTVVEDKDNAQNDSEIEAEDPQSVDKLAIEALVGASHAKRRKIGEDIQVVDLSSEQVLPNRHEWMRAALAAETTYQPKGVLVDEEPAPGTRKKHQITYLAHQAKANEAELQAMWAANRQTRRATASKYGF